MKGYKGFNKGLVCMNKQYAENTVFEEPTAEICRSGMHFCTNPFEVLNYYPLIDDDGNINEFAEVEALDECKTDDNKKYCTKKLKVGAKLNLGGFVNACVEFVKETTKPANVMDGDLTDYGGDSAKLASSGDYAQLASSGFYAQLASSGFYAQLASSGFYAQLASSGFYAKLASSGDYAQLASSGNSAKLASSGNSAQLASSGNSAKLASSGDSAQLASSGDYAKLASSGNSAKLASSGDYAKLASSGDYAKLASSGNSAKLASSGQDSVVVCAGANSMAKAKVGSWITLAEWRYNNKKERYVPICVKTEQVDGERIKEDVFYCLKDGEFKEVCNE